MNLLHCRQNHNLFMRWNERENKENAVRLIVHSLTHRGERWEGGAWSEGMAGGGGSFVSTYKRDKMVWQYITFQYLLYKKGTFTYSYSNPGVGRNQKMWCCWSQIAIDYMKFCINPLRLVYVPPPPPPLSPRTSSAPSFPSLVLITTLCSLLHVVYRGVPKQFP